jgi:hypothetical protein
MPLLDHPQAGHQQERHGRALAQVKTIFAHYVCFALCPSNRLGLLFDRCIPVRLALMTISLLGSIGRMGTPARLCLWEEMHGRSHR